MKKGYFAKIESLTIANKNYRQVLYTAKNCQLVLMSLLPGQEIGYEIHEKGDQFFRFESGDGKVFIDESEYVVVAGDCIVVPEGSRHNVVNTSMVEDLKLYTIYSPPHHQNGLLRAIKEEAESSGVYFDGKTSE